MSEKNVEYSANNSGGTWWLKDAHWKALEAAGWEVEWGGKYFCGSDSLWQRPANKSVCGAKGCRGHRRFDSAAEAAAIKDGRFLGALAHRATRRGLSLKAAIEEWERITGKDSSDLGCGCCGAPHRFSFDDGSGKREHYSPESPTNGERYAGD